MACVFRSIVCRRVQLKMNLILINLFAILVVNGTPENPRLTFEHLYQYGKNEYTRGNWQDCVAFLLRALDDFNYFRDETLWCREYCGKLKLNKDDLVREDAKSDWMTTRVMFNEAQRALCLMKCQQDKFATERPVLTSQEIYEEFRKRKPFHYLQFCYWKMNDLANAVKSAYTYLIANPKDEDTLVNLHFYMEQKGFNREKMMVDTLQKPFERLYIEGVQFYDSEEWHRCGETFERSLGEFINEDKKCRLQCEDFLDWSSVDTANPELSIVFTSFYTSFVRCRRRCEKDLSKINGREIPNFLASYFEYMHVCQFRINKGRDACHSVANAILLNPKNILMRRNKLFYMKTYEKPELFEPTPEIEGFYKKMELERRFIEFIDQKFHYVDKQLSPSHIDDRRLMDTQVDISDAFDYSLLQQPIISKDECQRLLQAASIPLPEKFFRFKNSLIEELRQRVTNIYGDAPTFNKLVCVPRGSTQTSGCTRGAFIIGIGLSDEYGCGTILADRFTSCAVVFCVN